MPFPGFQLCHGQPPDACVLGCTELFGECGKILKQIEQSFPQAWRLSRCRSSAKKAKGQLLERFNFPTHQENGRTLARGIYLLFDGKQANRDNAFYVGITNDVPKRITDHLRAASHHQSSLLYLLMKRHLADGALWNVDEATGNRRAKMRKDLFRENHDRCREIRDHLLDHCSVVIYPVPDIVTLHVLEALAALEFRTGPWNSFRPH